MIKKKKNLNLRVVIFIERFVIKKKKEKMHKIKMDEM